MYSTRFILFMFVYQPCENTSSFKYNGNSLQIMCVSCTYYIMIIHRSSHFDLEFYTVEQRSTIDLIIYLQGYFVVLQPSSARLSSDLARAGGLPARLGWFEPARFVNYWSSEPKLIF